MFRLQSANAVDIAVAPVEPPGSEAFRNLSVAIVHDWCPDFRGGERVLARLCRLFPRGGRVHAVRLSRPGDQGAPFPGNDLPHVAAQPAAGRASLLPVALFACARSLSSSSTSPKYDLRDLVVRRLRARRADASGPAASVLCPQPGALRLGRAVHLHRPGWAGLRAQGPALSPPAAPPAHLGRANGARPRRDGRELGICAGRESGESTGATPRSSIRRWTSRRCPSRRTKTTT